MWVRVLERAWEGGGRGGDCVGEEGKGNCTLSSLVWRNEQSIEKESKRGKIERNRKRDKEKPCKGEGASGEPFQDVCRQTGCIKLSYSWLRRWPPTGATVDVTNLLSPDCGQESAASVAAISSNSGPIMAIMSLTDKAPRGVRSSRGVLSSDIMLLEVLYWKEDDMVVVGVLKIGVLWIGCE